ncbi:heavy metal response regulator transcription factor [Vibrio sp. Of7-15]|uniref:heavy metal response regulator transcription factor n=1 Tax=Vibrio sp. Of7-15 TaxID=2724879 RepID=UPI001EF38D43|nr:heavy metal response regulator transcription factor [Vibrio sp. Of7-15]MCG7499407.1 heavy metal response regulator transcription factor [Vibrio sp. Of7-15]
MKILIIEDEKKLGLYLKQGLTETGFVIDLVFDGVEGLNLALSPDYDLILLDIMLPNINGWEILKQVRKYDPTQLVIILTARDSVDDRVMGLELGADDYLVKPFSFSELVARIRNQFRKISGEKKPTTLIVADLELDQIKRKVTRSKEKIELTPKELALLEFFMQHEGEILSKTLIASKIWDINFHSDTNVIEVAVKRLRKRIDDGFQHKLIHTVRGMGYVMEYRC